MDNEMIRLMELSALEPWVESFSRMGNSYIFARFRGSQIGGSPMSKPLRFDCMTIIVCRRGSFDVEVNLQEYHIAANTMLVVSPGMLLKMASSNSSRLDLYMIFISREFLMDINIDLNALNIRSLIEHRSPAITLTDAEAGKLVKYLEFLDMQACEEEETVFSKNVARSLCAAVFYQLLQFSYLRIGHREDESREPLSRRSTYVHDFMRLVHLNYMKERAVSFYADQLFISPKYLTLLVKEATNRSPGDWINEFVVIEAKNLLRFSGKNVQQVAYALNFSNQTSFGKYFKRLTGFSPSEYQKT